MNRVRRDIPRGARRDSRPPSGHMSTSAAPGTKEVCVGPSSYHERLLALYRYTMLTTDPLCTPSRDRPDAMYPSLNQPRAGLGTTDAACLSPPPCQRMDDAVTTWICLRHTFPRASYMAGSGPTIGHGSSRRTQANMGAPWRKRDRFTPRQGLSPQRRIVDPAAAAPPFIPCR